MKDKGKTSINQRINVLLREKRYSNSAFEKANGLANGTIRKITIQENYNPSFKVIFAFAETFPDLNLRWLIKGEGEMLESEVSVNHDLLGQLIRRLDELESEVRHLKVELEK